MRTRARVVTAAMAVVSVVALGWWFVRPTAVGAGQASSTHAEATEPTGQRPAKRDSAERPTAGPWSEMSPSEVQALEARDRRRRDVMVPFGTSLLAALDGCLTPGPGPRVPQRLLLHFERVSDGPRAGSSGKRAGFETFTLKSVAPADMPPGKPALLGTQVGTCLSTLAGRTLDIPSGPGSQEDTFQEVVAIPIPAAVAWAPPSPPHFPPQQQP